MGYRSVRRGPDWESCVMRIGRRLVRMGVTRGNLIQRLALESEQKQRAEAEVTRVKQQCQRDMEALSEQNRRLVENSRALEQKYREVEEVARLAREKQTSKPVPHTVVREETQGFREPVQKREPRVIEIYNVHGEQKTSKAVPPRPVKQKSKEKRVKMLKRETDDEMAETLPKREPAENGKGRFLDETLPSGHPKEEEKRARFLLPKREGASLERMERGENEELEEQPYLLTRGSPEELKARADQARKRQEEKELMKRAEGKKNTLADILRLKAEIEEGVDLEGRQRQADRQAKVLQVDLERRLDHMQTLAHKGCGGDPQYLKSLREAYEASSDEEERLARRALANKREGLVRLRAEKQKTVVRREESEAEGSCLYPQARIPVRTLLEPVQHPWEARGEEHPSPFPSLLPQVHVVRKENKRRSPPRGVLDTSDEEETPQLLPTGPSLDTLDEGQLRQVKALVDKRIAEAGRGLAKRGQEEAELRIDDDFYDARFLDLVYEMESRGEESKVSQGND